MKLLVLDLVLLLLLLLLLMLQLVAALARCVERKIIQSEVQSTLIQAKGAIKVVGHGVLSCILQSKGSEQGGVDGLLDKVRLFKSNASKHKVECAFLDGRMQGFPLVGYGVLLRGYPLLIVSRAE